MVAASLAMYSAARHGDRRLATPVLSLCLAAMVAQLVRQELRADPHAATQLGQGFGVLINALVLSLPWLLGVLIRTLGEQREQNARQAVFAERIRIARELHDVVAHHVSLMGIQAGAARIVMDRQPEQVAVALGSIEASSRQAVAELHRLLGLLRRPDDVVDLVAAQPGLAQLGDLVEQAKQGRLTVDLSIEGPPRVLPPTLDASAYRIIQEALTNTRKHSRATSAVVRVHYGAATLDVDVVDDGNGQPEIASDAGGRPWSHRDARTDNTARRPTVCRPTTRGRVRRPCHLPAEPCARMTIAVVLVDDQAMVRAGFRMILDAHDDIDVVGEASDGDQAVTVIRQLPSRCGSHGHRDAQARRIGSHPSNRARPHDR